jgi:Bacterial membrane protein YfhO
LASRVGPDFISVDALPASRAALLRLNSKSLPFQAVIAVLVLTAAGCLFLYPLWLHRGIVYSKYSDIMLQLSTTSVGKCAVAQEAALPLWNPSMDGGLPALANPQSKYLFPFDLLFFVLPIDLAANLVSLLNVLLAGVSMYLFSRRHVSLGPALFAGFAYMLSFRYLAMIHVGWLPKMSMYALTPLLFWACEALLQSPSTARVWLFSLVVGLSFAQGDMQQLYYAGIGLLIYLAFRSLLASEKARARPLLTLGGAGLLGILLAGPVLFPCLQYAWLSTRTEANYAAFLARPPALADLQTLLAPCDNGGMRQEFWENNFYFGFWLLPLLPFAFRKNWRRAALLLAGVLVMLALCFDSPLLRFAYHFIPGFHLFRQSPRILLLAQFVLVFLAALGAEDLLEGLRDRSGVLTFLACVPVCVAVVLFAALDVKVGLVCLGAGMLLFIALLFCAHKQFRLPAIACLCLLPILDSAVRAHPLIAVRPLSQIAPRHPVYDLLNRQHGRVLFTRRELFPYALAGYYGIDTVNGYSPMTLKHFIDYFVVLQFGTPAAIPHFPIVWTDLLALSRPGMLHALDVRLIVSDGTMPFERSGYEKVGHFKDVPTFRLYQGLVPTSFDVWRSKQPLGPAYFASSVRGVRNDSQSLSEMLQLPSVLDASVCGLDRDPAQLNYAGGSVRELYRGYNRYEYQLESRGSNYLILSQVWFPGWAAMLDGHKLKLYRTNHALLGCFIPPGQHRLVLRMTSPPFTLGLITAGAALLLLALFSFAKGRYSYRKASMGSSCEALRAG